MDVITNQQWHNIFSNSPLQRFGIETRDLGSSGMFVDFVNASVGDLYWVQSSIEGPGISTATSWTLTSGTAFENYAGAVNPIVLNNGTTLSNSWAQILIISLPATIRSTKTPSSSIPAGTLAFLRIVQVSKQLSY